MLGVKDAKWVTLAQVKRESLLNEGGRFLAATSQLFVYTAKEPNFVRIVNKKTGKNCFYKGHGAPIIDIRFAAAQDCNVVATLDKAGCVHVWNVANDDEEFKADAVSEYKVAEGSAAAVVGFDWVQMHDTAHQSHDQLAGKNLVVFVKDGSLRTLSPTSAELSEPLNADLSNVDGPHLLSGGVGTIALSQPKGHVAVVSTKTWRSNITFQVSSSGAALSALHKSTLYGNRIYTGSDKNNTVTMWEVRVGGEVKKVFDAACPSSGSQRLFSVHPQEQYVLLGDTGSNSLAVVSIEKQSVLQWDVREPLVGLAAISLGKSGSVAAALLQSKAVTIAGIDVSEFGSATSAAAPVAAAEATPEKTNDVTSWFKKPTVQQTPPTAAPAGTDGAMITSTKHSSAANTSSEVQAVERAASEALRKYHAFTKSAFDALDNQVKSFQATINSQPQIYTQYMQMLGEEAVRMSVQRMGDLHALAKNIAAKMGSGAGKSAPVVSAADLEHRRVQVQQLLEAIEKGAVTCLTQACNDAIVKSGKDLGNKSWQRLKDDLTKSLSGKNIVHEQKKDILKNVDQMNNEFLVELGKEQANIRQYIRDLTTRVSQQVDKSVAQSKQYNKSLKEEIQRLRTDMIAPMIAAAGDAAAVAQPSQPAYSRERVMGYVNEGHWNRALECLFGAADVRETLWFLEADAVQNGREHLLDPAELNLPNFMALVNHLVFDLSEMPDLIAFRVVWLEDFVSSWLDVLHDEEHMARVPRETQELLAELFERAKDILGGALKVHAKRLDTSTQRKMRGLQKLLR